MRVRILVVIAVCAAVIAVAQTAPSKATIRSLSLQECIQLALTHNLDMRIGQRTAEIARFNLSGAYGAYDPVFSFRATHSHIAQPADFDPQKFNQDFPYNLTTESAGTGLEGLLPIGMSYNFSGQAGKKSATTDFNSDADDASNYFWGVRETNNFFADAGVTARQHLLKDFWIDQPREVIRIRRKELKMTEQAVRFQVMRILLAVELGYYDLVAAREQVRVEEKALELKGATCGRDSPPGRGG